MKKRAFIYIILAGIFWGTSGIFANYLTPYGFTSVQLTAIRAFVSFFCMLIYSLILNRKMFRAKLKDLILFAAIGVSIFLTASFYFSSMQATSISTAVILMYTAPIYVMIFSVLFLGEKLSRLKLISVVLMLIGCCLVSGVIGGLKFDAFGIITGALSGLAYGAYNILTKISMKCGCAPESTTLYSFFFMALFAAIVSKPIEIINLTAQKPAFLIPMSIGIGVVTCVLPYFLYTYAMKYLPAGTASSLGIVEPMAATLFSIIIFREALDIFSFLGIALILVSVFMLSKADDSEK